MNKIKVETPIIPASRLNLKQQSVLSEAEQYHLINWQVLLKNINFYYDSVDWHLENGQIVSDPISADQAKNFKDKLKTTLSLQGYQAGKLFKEEEEVTDSSHRIVLDIQQLSTLLEENPSNPKTIEDHISSILSKKFTKDPSKLNQFNEILEEFKIPKEIKHSALPHDLQADISKSLKELPKDKKIELYKELYEKELINKVDFFEALSIHYGYEKIEELLPEKKDSEIEKEDSESQEFEAHEYLAYWCGEIGYTADITLQAVNSAPRFLNSFATNGYPAVGVLDFCLTFKSILDQLYGKDLNLKNVVKALSDNAYILAPMLFITQSFVPIANQTITLVTSTLANAMNSNAGTLSNITAQTGRPLTYLAPLYLFATLNNHRVSKNEYKTHKQENHLERIGTIKHQIKKLINDHKAGDETEKEQIETQFQNLLIDLAEQGAELQTESSTIRLEAWVSILELSSYAISNLFPPAILGSAIASSIRLLAQTHGHKIIENRAEKNHGIIKESGVPAKEDKSPIFIEYSKNLSDIIRQIKKTSSPVILENMLDDLVSLEPGAGPTQLKNAIGNLEYKINFLRNLISQLLIEYPDNPPPRILNLEKLQQYLARYAQEILQGIDKYISTANVSIDKRKEWLLKKNEIQNSSVVLKYRQEETKIDILNRIKIINDCMDDPNLEPSRKTEIRRYRNFLKNERFNMESGEAPNSATTAPIAEKDKPVMIEGSSNLNHVISKFKKTSAPVILSFPDELTVLDKKADSTEIKNAIGNLKNNINFLWELTSRLIIEYLDNPQPKILNLEILQLQLRQYTSKIIQRIDNYIVSHPVENENERDTQEKLLNLKNEIQIYLRKSLNPEVSTVLDYRQEPENQTDIVNRIKILKEWMNVPNLDQSKKTEIGHYRNRLENFVKSEEFKKESYQEIKNSPDNHSGIFNEQKKAPINSDIKPIEKQPNASNTVIAKFHKLVESLESDRVITVIPNRNHFGLLKHRSIERNVTEFINSTSPKNLVCNRVLRLKSTDPIPTIEKSDLKSIYIRPDAQGKYLAWWAENGVFKEHVIKEEHQTEFNDGAREIVDKEKNPERFKLLISKCGYTKDFQIFPYIVIKETQINSINSFSTLKDCAEGLKTELQWLNEFVAQLPKMRPGAKIINLKTSIDYYKTQLKLVQDRLKTLTAEQNPSYGVRLYNSSGLKFFDFGKASSEVEKVSTQLKGISSQKFSG